MGWQARRSSLPNQRAQRSTVHANPAAAAEAHPRSAGHRPGPETGAVHVSWVGRRHVIHGGIDAGAPGIALIAMRPQAERVSVARVARQCSLMLS